MITRAVDPFGFPAARVAAPRPHDEAAGARALEAAGDAAPTPEARRLVEGVGGCSPYLGRLMARERAELAAIFAEGPAGRLAAATAAAAGGAQAAGAGGDLAPTMAALRQAKRRAALAAGLAEISGAMDTMTAARAWSDFADAALGAALDTAVAAARSAARARGFASPGADENVETGAPGRCSGLVFLAMGKLGSQELNYSSDIDLIALYDPNAASFGDPASAREIAVSATRTVCRILQEQTADGYVFRTDLRLRPDPGVSAAAVSVGAAEAYYEAYGQNWERAAFIRARPAAGDLALGERFLERLRPFIWRKYLDFAAIDDVHSIVRQIHAAKGGGEIEFYGHDLKTGRGGIREIEFLVQTRQLILGGKAPALRARGTLDALGALVAAGAIDAPAADDLGAAYRYLRMVEHRIQMINDEQTHKTPSTPEGADRLAAFLGEADREALAARLRGVLGTTHARFADLFERSDRLSGADGTLSFTGVEDNPETIATLTKMGFNRARDIAAALRRWHAGGVRATRTVRARELLTRLGPTILQSLAAASDPDDAFVAFDQFLGRLPAGVQIFSMLANAPHLFDRLIQIMTLAPELLKALARRRHLVEALLERPWPQPAPTRGALEAALAAPESAAFEDVLNAARRRIGEARFEVAAQLVVGVVSPAAAAAAFTDIAEAAVSAMLDAARRETARAHGTINGEVAVIAFGRLGARAMTAASDLDLVVVYDADADARSSGGHALDAVTYFTRLVRRFVTALTAQTEDGVLYPVDMALRPSGGAGPAAVSRRAFEAYYAEDAWTWEAMALTKARVVAGDVRLGEDIAAEIDRIIARPRPPGALARDVAAMRARLAAAKAGAASEPWAVKSVIGGLTDLDFLMQYLQLREGRRFDLKNMPEGLIAPTLVEDLLRSGDLFDAVLQIARAATGEAFSPSRAGLALQQRISQACGVETLPEAEIMVTRAEEIVKRAFDAIVSAAADDDVDALSGAGANARSEDNE